MKMKKDQALEKMKQGFKVSNEYFTSDEYLFMNASGAIISEDGYNFNDWFFNIRKGEEWKLEGWSVYNG